ncbi:hypothetical protein HDV00_012381, partial [Rhizophlyctis rosea]
MLELLQKIYMRAYADKTNPRDVKARMSGVKRLVDLGLTQYMFALPAFLKAVDNLRIPDGAKKGQEYKDKKMRLQAVCRIFTHATKQELVDLYHLHKVPKSDEEKAFDDMLLSDAS